MSAWPNPVLPLYFAGVDKVVHAGLYSVLGLSLALGRQWALSPPPHLLMLSVGVLYGMTDEWHQAFVRGRSPDVGDWVADVAGVLLGYGVLTLLVRRRVGQEQRTGE